MSNTLPLNSVICGNAVIVLYEFPPESVDLTITSPPYDNTRKYEGYNFIAHDLINRLKSVTKPGGVVVWIVADQTLNGSETGTSFRQALTFMDYGFNLHDTMIYAKTGCPYPSQERYYQIFEYMFIFSKGKPKTFNPIKDRKNRWHGQKWGGFSTRRQGDGTLRRQSLKKLTYSPVYGVRNNIWTYQVGYGYTTKDTFAHQHPAIMPEALARDHVISWSNPGDVVLDPMCGSGTTLKVAKQLGRDFIGIDISETYCQLSRKRIQSTNPPLFLMD